MKEKTVVLGLSGGVDSACTAVFLREQGYTVIGAFLSNSGSDDSAARRTAQQLGIDFVCIDMTQKLESQVIEPFVRGYACGMTPIPCVLCNPAVKFRLLFDLADRLGAQYVATGHYARTGRTAEGVPALYRSPASNDQAYMLYRLPCAWIERLLLPLGEEKSKADIRAYAHRAGVDVFDKPDSMEICFIPDNDYAAFIESRGVCPPPGDFVDEQGRVLGRHKGIHHYTVGQRRGLGIAAEGRLYVTRIDPQNNRVVLALTDPYRAQITLGELYMTAPEYGALSVFEADVMVRHGKKTYPARVVRTGETAARVDFHEPARAPSPGQSAVFFGPDGRVLGGGIIQREAQEAGR